ncbi:hypothetical protein CVU75_01660 [Candidatus Dependentiae bacterium HGW-Dependentiae-1]|nr:MAG: hypothetical protein CVU75_01660 [Candidatus Dependentiae bacterium HGW-Dependentiae-1]
MVFTKKFIHAIFTITLLLSLTQVTTSTEATKKLIIILDPAGDENHTGRVIENTFERGLTLQCAQALQQELETRIPNSTVILTRKTGKAVTTLQNASLANRMAADLYISIHFFQETSVKPTVFLYQFSYNDDQLTLPATLAFYPYDQAHRIHSKQTSAWIGLLKALLTSDSYKKGCSIKGAFKIPFAPLIGIIAPAIGIEAGLIHANDWQLLVEPITQSIIAFAGQI